MKLVVIGGHSRDIGKTSVTAGIIAASRDLNWTALKITQYGHDICSANGEECDCAVEEPDCSYAIQRETDQSGCSDTARFLQAGAHEAYWLRTRAGQLAEAVPALERLMKRCEFVMIESNSILEFVRPDLYLPVLKFDVADFKASSQRHLDKADAYVVVGSDIAQPTWSGVNTNILAERPVFAVAPPSYSNAAIAAFIREKLGLAST